MTIIIIFLPTQWNKDISCAIRACGRRDYCDTPRLMKTAIPQFLIALLILCLGLSENAQAVSPPPDGGYAGGNTAEGQSALLGLTTGTYNTAVGLFSLRALTNGRFNTAIGAGALLFNTADQNTATGAGALLNNTTGIDNTAMGESALFFNTTGNNNTGIGATVLTKNTTGSDNTAIGVDALFNNTTGSTNTAIGRGTLSNNTTGPNNTAIGTAALTGNTTGERNTATGRGALSGNTTGQNNTAIGSTALSSNTQGNDNTALGVDALFNSTGSANTAIGRAALANTTGGFNTALGHGAGEDLTTGENNIDIDNPGVAGESSTIRIGQDEFHAQTFIAGITGVAVAGTSVVVTGSGQLGVAPSSERFKYKITSMDKTSEAILSLKPVAFYYKKEIDPKGVPQFGLVAEEVEKVDPDLVVRDKKGKPYTVRYDAVNAMLLNEFLKEHRKNEKQEATIARLEKQVETLTADLQKVSAQLEVIKPAPQTVLNNQ
jgi:hypothetical protein